MIEITEELILETLSSGHDYAYDYFLWDNEKIDRNGICDPLAEQLYAQMMGWA